MSRSVRIHGAEAFASLPAPRKGACGHVVRSDKSMTALCDACEEAAAKSLYDQALARNPHLASMERLEEWMARKAAEKQQDSSEEGTVGKKGKLSDAQCLEIVAKHDAGGEDSGWAALGREYGVADVSVINAYRRTKNKLTAVAEGAERPKGHDDASTVVEDPSRAAAPPEAAPPAPTLATPPVEAGSQAATEDEGRPGAPALEKDPSEAVAASPAPLPGYCQEYGRDVQSGGDCLAFGAPSEFKCDRACTYWRPARTDDQVLAAAKERVMAEIEREIPTPVQRGISVDIAIFDELADWRAPKDEATEALKRLLTPTPGFYLSEKTALDVLTVAMELAEYRGYVAARRVA